MDSLAKNRFAVLVAIVATALSVDASDSGAESAKKGASINDGSAFDCQIDPTAESNFSLALFRIWLPSRAPVKGVLTVLPGSDAHGTPMAEDPRWQAIAAKWNYALLGITFTTRSSKAPYYRAEDGSGQALLSALTQLAESSSHPELKDAPVAILGHSQGGQFAFHFACWKPKRTIVFATIKGGYYDAKPTGVARAAPGILFTGELDAEFRRTNIRTLFDENLGANSRWCFALEPEAGHEVGRCPDLFIPFFDAVISGNLQPYVGDPDTLRLTPADGSLAPEGAWLPNHEVAQTWVHFMERSLPKEQLEVGIPSSPPPRIAQVSPGAHDFGKIETGARLPSAVFHVTQLTDGPAWDFVRAFSLRSRCDVTVSNTGDEWLVTARPALDGLPLGRLSESILLRFYNQGHPVPGGAELNVSFLHVSDYLSLSSHYFYLGVHSDSRKMAITLTSRNGKKLQVRDAKLLDGTGATIEVFQKNPTSVVLTATFLPLPEPGNHSGTFAVSLDEPVKTELLIPFIGAYKSATRAASQRNVHQPRPKRTICGDSAASVRSPRIATRMRRLDLRIYFLARTPQAGETSSMA